MTIAETMCLGRAGQRTPQRGRGCVEGATHSHSARHPQYAMRGAMRGRELTNGVAKK